jgi:hypothetical protein
MSATKSPTIAQHERDDEQAIRRVSRDVDRDLRQFSAPVHA